MILNQRPAEKSILTMLHLSTKSIHNTSLSLHLPRSHPKFHTLPCFLLLENSVPASCVLKIFQSTHGWRCTLFLNIKPIHKTSLSPTSSFTSGVSLSSLLTSPREFGPASCVVKIFQSTHGWRCTLFLNINPIHKTLLSPSFSFSGVCSASSGTSRGSGLATYEKKHK